MPTITQGAVRAPTGGDERGQFPGELKSSTSGREGWSMSKVGIVLGSAMLALGLMVGWTEPAHAQKRVALVIGNNAYERVEPLQTAVNDARVLADVLRKLGFSVLIAENQSRKAMSESLLAFDRAIEAGDMAFFFFAGHGFEIRGQNYLLPTDVPAATEGQEELIRDASFAADRIIDRLQARGARTAILVLDACRNNPFARPGSRAVRGTGGLAPMPPVEGVFVLFSAGAKQVALDRLSTKDPNPNSVFTRHFARQLPQPGLTLVQIAKRTQTEVKQLAATVGGDQTPAYYDQIVGDLVLNRSSDKPRPTGEAAAQLAALPSAVDKQPLRQDPPIGDAGSGAIAELRALAAAENWRELGAHLKDVKPTARDQQWNELVEQAAIGELTPLTAPSSGSAAERLATIERYFPTYPSLRSSPRFLALRTAVGLDAFGRCFDEARGNPELFRCRDSLDRFVRIPPMGAEAARDAGKIVGRKLNRAAAAPFFALALEAPRGKLVCADAELSEAVIAALGRPPDALEAKAGLALAEGCWAALKTAVVANVARESADSYYVRNTCPTLMKFNAVTGLRADRCREIMAR